MEREFSFISKDGIRVYGYKWLPENKMILGVVQIVHGSVEHAQRYKEFGDFLVEKGYAVYIHDQRGHGKTAQNTNELSILSNEIDGWQHAKDDIVLVNNMIKKDYPDLAIFMLGHSMGSFLVRDIISEEQHIADGVILTGSIPMDFKNTFLYKSASLYIRLLEKIKGRTFRDRGLHRYIYEDLTLTRDKRIVKAYQDDILCGYTATLEYLGEMFKGMITISKRERINLINKELPIFILSGELDKVADGKISTVYDAYKESGIKDVEIKIYEDAYHEILNEINREEVYNDIINWINKRNSK